jgi:hypothetical protein
VLVTARVPRANTEQRRATDSSVERVDNPHALIERQGGELFEVPLLLFWARVLIHVTPA